MFYDCQPCFRTRCIICAIAVGICVFVVVKSNAADLVPGQTIMVQSDSTFEYESQSFTVISVSDDELAVRMPTVPAALDQDVTTGRSNITLAMQLFFEKGRIHHALVSYGIDYEGALGGIRYLSVLTSLVEVRDDGSLLSHFGRWDDATKPIPQMHPELSSHYRDDAVLLLGAFKDGFEELYR